MLPIGFNASLHHMQSIKKDHNSCERYHLVYDSCARHAILVCDPPPPLRRGHAHTFAFDYSCSLPNTVVHQLPQPYWSEIRTCFPNCQYPRKEHQMLPAGTSVPVMTETQTMTLVQKDAYKVQ